MKARLSQNNIIVINVVIVTVFVIGLYLSNFSEGRWIWPGIICQVVSLLYTIVFGFLSLRPHVDVMEQPTPYFTDRKEVLHYVIEQLYEITYNHGHEQIIAIKYEGTEGIGKTELLRKIKQILSCKSSAKDCLSDSTYAVYKRVRRKLGLVHFVTYTDDHTLPYINKLPYVLFKKNIVLVDDLPSLANNPFSARFLIICCQPLKGTDESRGRLQKFSEEDVRFMYRAKFQAEIDEVFLRRVLDYTQGNVAQVSNIFKSQDMCEAFQREMPQLYLLYS